jgi:hypothetical protein
VPPQPALRDRVLDAGAVFGRTAAGGEKGAIDPLDIDAGSAALAISISFRTAASGSLNGLGSANFTGFVLGWHVLTACRIFDGASVNRAQIGPWPAGSRRRVSLAQLPFRRSTGCNRYCEGRATWRVVQ